MNVDGTDYVSGKTGNWGTDDIDALIPQGYTGNITISQEGYHSFTFPTALTGAYNVITMRSTAYSDPYAHTLLMNKSQGAYMRFRNLLVENEYVNKPSLQDFLKDDYEYESGYFYPIINWNGHGAGKVWLQQGKTRLNLTENEWNVFAPAEEFEKYQDIYLCTEAADGTASSQKIKLQIGQYTSEMPFDLGNAFSVPTGTPEAKEEVPKINILSGKALSFDLGGMTDGKIPITFGIKEDGTIEGLIGIRLANTEDKFAAYGKMVDSLERIEESDPEEQRKLAKMLDDLKAEGHESMPQSGSLGIDGGVQLVG